MGQAFPCPSDHLLFPVPFCTIFCERIARIIYCRDCTNGQYAVRSGSVTVWLKYCFAIQIETELDALVSPKRKKMCFALALAPQFVSQLARRRESCKSKRGS